MKQLITAIGRKLWPDLDILTEIDRLALLRELFGVLYWLPFVFLALGWLVAVTNWGLLRQQWPVLLLFLVLSIIAGRLSSFRSQSARAAVLIFSLTGRRRLRVIIVGTEIETSSLILVQPSWACCWPWQHTSSWAANTHCPA